MVHTTSIQLGGGLRFLNGRYISETLFDLSSDLIRVFSVSLDRPKGGADKSHNLTEEESPSG